MLTARTAEIYRCPGDEYDITRSVHLARLAAFYSKCRNCPHAPDARDLTEACDPGQLPTATDDSSSLFTAEGVRGRYLNDLSRATAAKIAGAMASCLWEEYSLRVPSAAQISTECLPASPSAATAVAPQTAAEGVRLLAPGRPGPSVVLGHDERPSSPDIVTGVGQMLRRMGCQVVDIGLATRPCLLFAVNHLGAAGAVHVTGAGCDPGWTGLDFVMHGNLPCSSPGTLDRVADCYRDGYSRPSRRPGSQRTFQASVPYEAGLWKHFHALRPLKIALACPSRAVRELFVRVFRKLACRLMLVETPTRQRSMLDPADPDLKRTSQHIREGRADLGMFVDGDGERCTFFDEQGVLVSPSIAARLLAIEQNERGVTGALAVLDSNSDTPCLQRSREAITRVMGERGLRFAADDSGRYWFTEGHPTCDAVLTLVHLLQCLSRSDRQFSEVVAG